MRIGKSILLLVLAACLTLGAFAMQSCQKDDAPDNSSQVINEAQSPEPAEGEGVQTDAKPAEPQISTVVFTNKVGVRIGSVYVSDPSSNTWGDPIYQGVDEGIAVDLELGTSDALTCDFAVIDNNRMNYNFYSVTFTPGDALTLKSDGTLIVSNTQGTERYTCEPFAS